MSSAKFANSCITVKHSTAQSLLIQLAARIHSVVPCLQDGSHAVYNEMLLYVAKCSRLCIAFELLLWFLVNKLTDLQQVADNICDASSSQAQVFKYSRRTESMHRVDHVS